MTAVRSLCAYFVSLRLRLYFSRLDSRRYELQTYRVALRKPPNIHTRKLELFYHSRRLKLTLQFLLVSALIVWTVKNYVAVFRSL